MEEILCTGLVADVAALIDKCKFPGDALMLVERLPQHVVPDEERRNLLQFTHLGRGINPAGSTSGRVFSQDFELRWQEEDGQYRAVYLGAKREIPGLEPDTKTLAELEPCKQPRYYYLFGEYLDDARRESMGLEEESNHDYYAEVRIPRLLLYPKRAAAQRVRLMVREYAEKATGRVQLFRFQDLRPEEQDSYESL